MKIGTLLLALGIAVLALGSVSINAHVKYDLTLGPHPVNLVVPPTATGSISIIENATNTTVYVLINHDGQNVVKLPYSSALTPGNWTIQGYKEVVVTVAKEVITQNETLKCGNVTTQRVVSHVVQNVSNNVTSPVYIHVEVDRMNLVQDPTLVDVAGGILTALGITLAILENRRSF
ncbi:MULTISPECIES: hypothetical protein [Metallosphaera]|uniref:Uncharacterized protein n=3 Tax=Metallosphaera TaxID=41980 RepID=A4YFN2_METS5|nr:MULTISPECIES: hypothetical protein [Metallosphaera]ABP95234.1 hypothetical protein Msed_1070 [Metallosphaera sedula DSM 5348]AIM27220.1 hypothetical protein HA72_1070 [Metallosphaera sedula]AKV74114.1 hypothetical protein MsedA_1083 [Metallosphaera sedula]AKV76354.1 hypothetical protein MsedB_1085 [Metallosphaera sedula]AKV78605.1 hypothetical protein MsedC_1083 [Metallosphaera sedula]